MEWLTEALKGITDETARTAIEESIRKGLGANFIPKDKFNEVNAELKAQKEMISNQETALKELGDKAKTADEKEQLILKLKTDADLFKAETDKRINDVKKISALQLQLTKDVDPSVVDLLSGLIILDTVKLEGDKITNYDELIKPIRETRSSLFKTTSTTTANTGGGDPPNDKVVSDADYFASIGLKPLK